MKAKYYPIILPRWDISLFLAYHAEFPLIQVTVCFNIKIFFYRIDYQK